MSRVQLYKAVGAILLLSFLVQAVTAIIIVLRIKVPHTQMIFEIHEYNGMFMIIVASMHVVLNWGWIKANFFKKR